MQQKIDNEERDRMELFEKSNVGDRVNFLKHGYGTIIKKSHFIVQVQIDGRKTTSFTTRHRIYFN